MNTLRQGVFVPPAAELECAGQVFAHWPVRVHIQELETFAGAAVGTAIVTYPAHYAENASPEMGKTATIKIGGRLVFRGIVGEAPFKIAENSDEVRLVLFDDKFLLNAKVVGQYGIGTQGDPVGSQGFKDVGFDFIFNKDGRPNKDPSTLDFNTGSTAVYWTLRLILEFLFSRYVDSDVARATVAGLSSAYDREPSHLALCGQTVLQAIDKTVQLSGESWALSPQVGYSAFVAVRPGGGVTRNCTLFKPRRSGRACDANEYYPVSIEIPKSVKDCRDYIQVLSAPIVVETTVSNMTNATYYPKVGPHLVQETAFKDKKYAVRFKVDVTKYSDCFLGANLSAGSKPKPWLTHLVTRLKTDGSGYLAKADLDADPTLLACERVKNPIVWILPDATTWSSRRLVVGGYRIDADNCHLDFESKIEIQKTATKRHAIVVADWTKARVLMTVATIVGLPESKTSDEDSAYLPKPFYEVIGKTDLVPERRRNVYLPDLADTDPEAVVNPVNGDEEKYVDIAAKLQDALDSAKEARADIATEMELRFPFLPEINLGDTILMHGRTVPSAGNECVIARTYQFRDGLPNELIVKATAVLAGVDPEQFLRRKKRTLAGKH